MPKRPTSKSARKASKSLICKEHNRLEIVSDEAAAIKKIFRPKFFYRNYKNIYKYLRSKLDKLINDDRLVVVTLQVI